MISIHEKLLPLLSLLEVNGYTDYSIQAHHNSLYEPVTANDPPTTDLLTVEMTFHFKETK